MQQNDQYKLKLINSIFIYRKDVFAIHWQEENKSGYSGRQIFLESNPENFIRIVHDYSDERKGFVIWKDMLEERLS